MSSSSGHPLKREEADIQAAEAILSIAPHHSSHNSISSQGATQHHSLNSTQNSPASSHRSIADETHSQRDAPPARLSLPSLSEALGRPPPPAPVFERERSPPRSHLRRSASPRSSRYHHHSEGYGPANRHDYREASPRPYPAPRPASFAPINSVTPTSPQSRSYAQWSMPPPPPPPPSHAHSHQTGTLPQAQIESPQWHPQAARQPPVQQSPSFAAQPFYAQQSDEHRYPPPSQPTQFVTSYPTLATSTRAGPQEPPWPQKPDSRQDYDRMPHPEYAESVKRHLDSFDMESSLNEVYDSSHNLMQFSQTYKKRVNGVERAPHLSSMEPTTDTIHEAIRFNQRIQDALTSILRRLEAQDAERAERSAKEMLERQQPLQMPPSEAPQPSPLQANPGERRTSGPTGPTPKTSRRGRAAAPGRCHSCNRAETPEWRRGPDGARTLCNACGLHYAKLTRKMGASKTALSPSSLRQKPLPNT